MLIAKTLSIIGHENNPVSKLNINLNYKIIVNPILISITGNAKKSCNICKLL